LNSKGFESEAVLGSAKYYARICLDKLQEKLKKYTKITRLQVEIRTKNLPNKRLEPYSYPNLFGEEKKSDIISDTRCTVKKVS
jgi:hypothetical protein